MVSDAARKFTNDEIAAVLILVVMEYGLGRP